MTAHHFGLAGLCVPQAHGAIGAARQQAGVIQKRHTAHPIGMAAELPQQAAGFNIPQMNHIIGPARSGAGTIRAEGDTEHPVGMAGQRLPGGLSGGGIPQAQRAIGAGRNQMLGAEIQREDDVAVPGQGLVAEGACRRIPQVDGACFVTGCQRLPIRTEGHGPYRRIWVWAAQRLPNLLASLCVPQADNTVFIGGGQQLTIRAEGEAVDPVFVACQRGASHLACFGIPQDDRMIAPGRSQPAPLRIDGGGAHGVAVPVQKAD